MPTRHASEDSSIAFEKWMSSPEYASRRPLPCNIVAAKAQLYRSSKVRSLLFYLQALSMQDGGLHAVAQELVQLFPARLCTPTMRAIGRRKPNEQEADKIFSELAIFKMRLIQDDFAAYLATASDESRADSPREFAAECERHAQQFFGEFLQQLCIDPGLDLESIAESKWSNAAPYFFDPLGAIAEYRARKDEARATNTVVTSGGKKVHACLDRTLATRRMEVIQAGSGFGKSHAAKSWCAAHTGEARFVDLTGITHRTGFFRRIAEAFGVGICQQSSSKLQAKLESLLPTARLMVVIDEAHYLWPQHQRSHSSPELVDWVNTALVNQGVPVALVCTDQFAKLQARVAKQTGWTDDQFKHRIFRYTKLTDRPTREDLEAVTVHWLSLAWDEAQSRWSFSDRVRPSAAAIKTIVGYAGANPLPLASVRAIVEDAQYLALQAGRITVSAADVAQALPRQRLSDLTIRSEAECAGKSKPARIASRSIPAETMAPEEEIPVPPKQTDVQELPVPIRRNVAPIAAAGSRLAIA